MDCFHLKYFNRVEQVYHEFCRFLSSISNVLKVSFPHLQEVRRGLRSLYSPQQMALNIKEASPFMAQNVRC